jgi:hypothetical protein
MPLATDVNLKNTIEIKVEELFNLAEVNKALILTETDLQCHLYMKLNEINKLSEISYTNDGFLTNKIHTEISWYSDNNADRLSIRPDITLLDPQNLKITSGFNGTPLPSKGLHSVDGGIIFELKFDRNLRTISEKTFDGVVKDIRNFETIYNRFSANGLGNLIYGYFILLIKSNNTARNISKIGRIQRELNIRNLDDSKCKFLYHFININ